jgi:hypothetical protein
MERVQAVHLSRSPRGTVYRPSPAQPTTHLPILRPCASSSMSGASQCSCSWVARERVLFIGTQFSILYTSMYSPAEAASCGDFSRQGFPGQLTSNWSAYLKRRPSVRRLFVFFGLMFGLVRLTREESFVFWSKATRSQSMHAFASPPPFLQLGCPAI